MRCAGCGTELHDSLPACARCGTPALVSRMAEAEDRAEALRTAYRTGALSETTYTAEFGRLAFNDPLYGSWSPGARRGEWLWWDGSAWVARGVPADAPPGTAAPAAPHLPRRSIPPMWMAIGCGLLSGLGLLTALVLVLVLAAPRDHEMSSSAAVSQPALAIERPSTSPPPTANATPTTPALIIRPDDPPTDSNVVNLANVATGSWDTSKPGTFTYQARFPVDQPAMISFGWCAKDATALEANWAAFTLNFVLDGRDIDLAQLARRDRQEGSASCRAWTGVIENLPPGPHSFVRRQHLARAINDGYDNFAPGDYTYIIEVEVGGSFALRNPFEVDSGPWPVERAGPREAWVEAGEYHLRADGGPAIVSVQGAPLSDTTLAASVRLVEPDSVGGLAFRYTDPSNFYYLLISRDGQYTLGMLRDGTNELLMPWTASPAIRQAGAANNLWISAAGLQIAVYANGQELTRLTEGALGSGTVGLIAQAAAGQQALVAFDNVLAYGMLAGVVSSTPGPTSALAGGPRVDLLTGDARTFTVPPGSIAYANTDYRAAPPEIALTAQCGGDCWRGNEWLTVRYGSDYWVEARSSGPTTAIGVQFWGLPGDGEVRVLLDGEQIWRGSIKGSGPQAGQVFLNYLQASDLPLAVHTLRVQPLGATDAATIYFFGIGEARE